MLRAFKLPPPKLLLFSSYFFSSIPPSSSYSLPSLLLKYSSSLPLTMLTAQDYPSGLFCDEAGVDMVLVGDSLGMTTLGYKGTNLVTMREMVHHAKAVKRGVKRAFLVGDMPFGSYWGEGDALKNATKFIRSEMNAIKLEGGREVAGIVKALTKRGIVVMGHIGLTPQKSESFGGFKVFGAKEVNEAMQLWEDAKILRDSGASFIVLECVPERLATLITQNLGIPTIGIGSGKGCSGQVLVYNDILGIYGKKMKFCKRYLNLSEIIVNACQNYKNDVEKGFFPVKGENTFIMKDEVFKEVKRKLEEERQDKNFDKSKAENNISLEKSNENSQENKVNLKKAGNEELHPILSKNNNEIIKNIIVVGSGALGSLIAAKLSQSKDLNVRMIGGTTQITEDEYNIKIGLNEGSSLKEFIVKKLDDKEINSIWNKEIDLLILCVKNYGTEYALHNLLNRFKEKPRIKKIISLQNGFGNKERITKALNEANLSSDVYQCSIYSGVKIDEKITSKIQLSQSLSENINISLPECLINSEIEKIFKNDNFVITNYTKPSFFRRELEVDWEKLIINSVINPLTAIFGVQNRIICENEEMINLAKSIINECLYILKFLPGALNQLEKQKKEVKGKDQSKLEEVILSKVLEIAKSTGTNLSSTLRDIQNCNEKTEIESFNGAFVEIAKDMGMDKQNYAVNEMMVNMVNGALKMRGGKKEL